MKGIEYHKKKYLRSQITKNFEFRYIYNNYNRYLHNYIFS